MSHELIYYATYFGLTLFFSTLFAMGGVGSAIALVPIFSGVMGIPLNLAKATGLFYKFFFNNYSLYYELF